MPRYPVTPATILLDKLGIKYSKHLYPYKKSGTVIAAEQMGVNKRNVIKTLIMQDNEFNSFIVLMHGDREVSLRELARKLGVKRISTVSIKNAQRITGYMVGGISPLGTKKNLPVYMEETILTLDKLYINAGRRGFIVEINPDDLLIILNPILVNVAR